MTLLEQIENDIDECVFALDNGIEDKWLIASTCRLMIANYDEKINFHEFAFQGTDESLRIILRALKNYKSEILEKEKLRLIEEKKQSKQNEIEDYKKEILYYKEKINSIESKLDKLISTMPNINIVNSMAQLQELTSKTDIDIQINNMFSDTRKKVLDSCAEDKEELLKRIDDLEKIIQECSSEEVKEGRIKSTLSWLGMKSKNTIELIMPLLQIILENKLQN